MSESQFFCPRLIDYLAIVGAHPNSSKRSTLYELQNNGTNSEERTGHGDGTGSMAANNENSYYVQVLLRGGTGTKTGSKNPVYGIKN